MPADPISQRHFEAAMAWLTLGSVEEAAAELRQIPGRQQHEPEILLLRCLIAGRAGQFSEEREIAKAAAEAYPERHTFVVHWVWAEHKVGDSKAALAIALKARARFPQCGVLTYAIACLYGASGQKGEAREWLEAALGQSTDPEKMRKKARQQPELAEIWNRI